MASQIATCRFCGRQGIESDTDPAPGICANGLDERMAAATGRISDQTTVEEAMEMLLDVGLSRSAAMGFLMAAVTFGALDNG